MLEMDVRVLEFWRRHALVQNKHQFLQMVVAARVAQIEGHDYKNFVDGLRREIFNLEHGVTAAEVAAQNRKDLKRIGGG